MELAEKTFFDQMNFKEIFRAKEKQGIYTLGSKVHNSGMVKIVRFLDFEETHVVKFNKLVCLGDLVYHTELGIDNLSVSDVFNNLYNFYNDNVGELPMLSDFVPNYDPNVFKESTAFQLLNWFEELLTKIEKI